MGKAEINGNLPQHAIKSFNQWRVKISFQYFSSNFCNKLLRTENHNILYNIFLYKYEISHTLLKRELQLLNVKPLDILHKIQF